MRILVTGAAGYIGSHATLNLLENGYDVVAFDSFSRAKPMALDRVKEISGQDFSVITGDIRSSDDLDQIFQAHKVDYIMHFAGLKSVAESVSDPGAYYDVNVGGTRLLASKAIKYGVRGLIFSSSATVYGDLEGGIADEESSTGPTNPYGWSKLMAERVLTDMAAAHPGFNVALLRYFNPVGAHATGQIGEDPIGVPANLLPFVAQVASGMREQVSVFGDDYDTPDGTGVRDYIHVVDLVDGHRAAIKALNEKAHSYTVNLGTGRGYSVLEMLGAFRRVTNRTIPHTIAPRRAGDVAKLVADPGLAQALLGWQARHGLDDMCRDHWNWQNQNPQGYEGSDIT